MWYVVGGIWGLPFAICDLTFDLFFRRQRRGSQKGKTQRAKANVNATAFYPPTKYQKWALPFAFSDLPFDLFFAMFLRHTTYLPQLIIRPS